jgi:malate dehydrogenase (oxaloacetate-decarboxylating)(NADP+)
LIVKIAPAVARAAMESGVAQRPISDFQAYEHQMQQFVYQSGTLMRPLFATARQMPADHKRIIYAQGEDERVLRAVQIVIDENLATPIIIGRPAVIEQRIEKFGLRMRVGRDLTLVNPDQDDRYRECWQTYHRMMARRGVTEQFAKLEMRRRSTLIGAMLLHRGDADGMICGTIGHTKTHLEYIDSVLGRRPGCGVYAAMNALLLPGRQLFLTDTHVNVDPTAQQLAEIAKLAADEVRRFGIVPKVALLSHSNFGSSDAPSAAKVREALSLLRALEPSLEVDGEMHADCALDEAIRHSILPDSTLTGEANVLVLPNIDAANIAYNLLKTTGGNGIAIGPILLGCAKPVHILTPSTTVRRIVNMTALTAVDVHSGRA